MSEPESYYVTVSQRPNGEHTLLQARQREFSETFTGQARPL